MEHVKAESSLVMWAIPPFHGKDDVTHGLYYVITGYDLLHGAVKLYNPICVPEQCVSDEKLPVRLRRTADPNKFW